MCITGLIRGLSTPKARSYQACTSKARRWGSGRLSRESSGLEETLGPMEIAPPNEAVGRSGLSNIGQSAHEDGAVLAGNSSELLDRELHEG